jgi:hypothetical protein
MVEIVTCIPAKLTGGATSAPTPCPNTSSLSKGMVIRVTNAAIIMNL